MTTWKALSWSTRVSHNGAFGTKQVSSIWSTFLVRSPTWILQTLMDIIHPPSSRNVHKWLSSSFLHKIETFTSQDSKHLSDGVWHLKNPPIAAGRRRKKKKKKARRAWRQRTFSDFWQVLIFISRLLFYKTGMFFLSSTTAGMHITELGGSCLREREATCSGGNPASMKNCGVELNHLEVELRVFGVENICLISWAYAKVMKHLGWISTRKENFNLTEMQYSLMSVRGKRKRKGCYAPCPLT